MCCATGCTYTISLSPHGRCSNISNMKKKLYDSKTPTIITNNRLVINKFKLQILKKNIYEQTQYR